MCAALLVLLVQACTFNEAVGARYEVCSDLPPHCADVGFECLPLSSDLAGPGVYCSRRCASASDCPASDTYGSAVCIVTGLDGQCFLGCTEDGDCPPDNQCTAATDGTRFCEPN
ncbi:MAG: hypothetical protein AB7S26_08305 [Sandaracinaceae bacterium]